MKGYDKSSRVLELILENDREILDVGCGSGEIARHLHALGRRVAGVEQDPAKAVEAKPFCQEVLAGDIRSESTLGRLRALRRSWDLILCSEILEHLPDPDKTLQELNPFLKPGGAFLVVLPNVAFYKTRLMLLRGKWNYQAEGIWDRTHLRFFTRESATALLEGAGLKVSLLRATHYSRRFAFLYNMLIRWRPGVFGEQFVIRAVPAADTKRPLTHAPDLT